MRKSFLIGVLCSAGAAIFACTKENPLASDAVPPPWRTTALTETAAGSGPGRAVDCNNGPKSSGSQPESSQALCDKYHIGYPVTGTGNGGSSGGCKKDTVVVPPPPVKDSCCR